MHCNSSSQSLGSTAQAGRVSTTSKAYHVLYSYTDATSSPCSNIFCSCRAFIFLPSLLVHALRQPNIYPLPTGRGYFFFLHFSPILIDCKHMYDAVYYKHSSLTFGCPAGTAERSKRHGYSDRKHAYTSQSKNSLSLYRQHSQYYRCGNSLFLPNNTWWHICFRYTLAFVRSVSSNSSRDWRSADCFSLATFPLRMHSVCISCGATFS